MALSLPVWADNSQTDFGGVGIDGVPLKDGQIVVKLSGTTVVLKIKRDWKEQSHTYQLIRRQIVIIPKKEKND